MGEPSLTEELWTSIDDVFSSILRHPFLTGLTDGNLDRESFRFYAVQDAHYLREYARALALLAARSPGEDELLMFSRHAAGAIEAERSLHDSFFRDFGLTEEHVADTPMAPTNLAYTSYLLATCHGGSFAEALGAVLPCYWIYQRVGQALLVRGSPDPLYERWIATYGGEEFAEVVQAVLETTDRLGRDLAPGERALVGRHFRQTSRYEWMFWDMGYRREEWPV
jgi:thiaminase (transcriptional activator TenA)